MNTNYDEGVQKDFNNMTTELGKERQVLTRDEVLTYEGFEGDSNDIPGEPMSAKGMGRMEVVQLQELDSKNEIVTSGLFKVGDVKFTFLSDSIVEEDSYVLDNGKVYKVLELTKYKGMGNDIITDIRAFGKKLPNR